MTACVYLLWAATAHADEPLFEINIPSLPVPTALEQLAEQTGTLTFFPYNLADGRRSTAVRGRYTLPAALNLLLEGTGLSGVLAEERVIGIAKIAPDGAGSLPANPESPDPLTGLPSPSARQAAANDDQVNSGPIPIEEITVTGLRSSLQKSAALKRRSRGIVDAITAEDLGKFPDINVAESLQRITGVGITRTRGGEGQFVTVRGLGEEFNAVTYNGRLLATENTGREFSFDVIASELIAGAEVYKSPLASQGDGSLGGQVNVRTARPLDGDGFRASAKLATQYEALAETWGPRASLVLGNTSHDHTLGFIASFSYQNRDARTDVAESTFLIPNTQVDENGLISASLDADGDGINDTTGAAITRENVRFNGFAPSVSFQQRERIGGTLALEYKPNDATDILIDALYTNFESPGTLFGYSYFPSASAGNFVGTNTVVNNFNQAVAFDIEPFALDLVSRLTEGRAETLAIGGNLKKRLSQKLSVSADVAHSRSDGNRDNFGSANGSGTFFVLGYPENPLWQFDASNALTPDARFSVENIAGDGFRTPIADLTADDIRLHVARRDTINVEDSVLSLRGDLQYAFSEARKVQAGLDYVVREKTNVALDNSGQDRQGVLRGYRTRLADVSPGLVPNLLTLFDDNFLADAPGNFPRVFPTFSVTDLERAFTDAGLSDALIPTVNHNASSVVQESVFGGYVNYDTDGSLGAMSYTFSAGVRFAYTDLESSGTNSTINSITRSLVLRDDDGVTLSAGQAFDLVPSTPMTTRNSYFDVLPTINFGLDLSERLKLRLSMSRSLSRPTLTDISTRFTITSTNLGGEQITSTNPRLEAIRSNNFDASLEWYGDNGRYLSAALFYKDLSDFVTGDVVSQSIQISRVILEADGSLTDVGVADVSFLVSTPRNGDKAEIVGAEIGGQYFFDSGFGLAGNVTLTDSDSTLSGRASQLENISDFSYNASVFYENHGWQLRASVNHRSDYLIGQTIEGGLDEFANEFTQLDLSLSYAKQFGETDYTFFLEGINVTNEKVIRLSEFTGANFLEAYEDNGARYVVGFRANF